MTLTSGGPAVGLWRPSGTASSRPSLKKVQVRVVPVAARLVVWKSPKPVLKIARLELWGSMSISVIQCGPGLAQGELPRDLVAVRRAAVQVLPPSVER